MKKRTDPHRPGAIIPADYEVWGFFAYAGLGGCPAFNMEMLMSPIVREHGMVSIDRESGGCMVCGKHFRYGALFRYTPTGQFIKLGHECARKYELLADFASFDAAFEAHRRANAATIQAEKNRQRYERALDKTPGLREALAVDHKISRDLNDKLRQWGSLSPAQINLAYKLHAETFAPRFERNETNVPAPTGRLTVRGTVISTKVYDSDFGPTLKMTVKMTTDAGTWLAWGTVPAMLTGGAALKGVEVEFTATFKQGRDAHFAIFSRPTGGQRFDQPEQPAAVEPRPGTAGNVVAALNTEIGIATVGYTS